MQDLNGLHTIAFLKCFYFNFFTMRLFGVWKHVTTCSQNKPSTQSLREISQLTFNHGMAQLMTLEMSFSVIFFV